MIQCLAFGKTNLHTTNFSVVASPSVQTTMDESFDKQRVKLWKKKKLVFINP